MVGKNLQMTHGLGGVVAVALLAMTATACDGKGWMSAPAADQTAAQDPKAATDAQGAQAASGDVALEQRRREPDWAAANKQKGDNASQRFSAQAAGSPVPMLVPQGVAVAQSGTPVFAQTDTGYVATFKTAKFDIIMNGESTYLAPPGAAPANDAPETPPVFSETDGGAQVSFRRFGVDYLVEFNCRVEAPCVTQAEALDIVSKLGKVG